MAKNIDEAKTSVVRGYLFDAAARIYQLLPFGMNQSTTAAWIATATTVYLYCCYGRFYNSWLALKKSNTDDCTYVQHSDVSLSNRKNPPTLWKKFVPFLDIALHALNGFASQSLFLFWGYHTSCIKWRCLPMLTPKLWRCRAKKKGTSTRIAFNIGRQIHLMGRSPKHL